MLSLLLALVMTLSLCVPALAADEFAAEAVTEVEEQAPEAPEAPVAPEAEEPAEEPVVDEPAVEEAVADAPEMASVMPEDAEDLPYLVALGKVSKINHYNLEKTLETAKTYKEKVDAGEMYVDDNYTDIAQETSPAKNFLDAYATAQKNLDGINGVVVDIDVTDASVLAAIAALKQYFSAEDEGSGLLKSDLKANMTATALYGGLKIGASYTPTSTTGGIMPADHGVQYTGTGTRTYPITTTTAASVNGDTDFSDKDWTLSYGSAYLTALENAQAEIKAFEKLGDSAKYADFAAVRETVLAAAKLEKEAALPEAGDADALAAAIKAANDIGSTTYQTNKNDYAAFDTDLFTKVAAAQTLLNTTLGLNGLNTYVRFNDVKTAIKDINDALVLKSNTFKFEKYEVTAENAIEVTVSIAEIGINTNTDGNTYGYAVKVGDYYFVDGTTNNDVKELDYGPSTATIHEINTDPQWKDDPEYPGRLTAKIKVSPAHGETKFASTDNISISFYMKNLTTSTANDTYGAAIDTETLTVSSDAYFGHKIKQAWVKDYGTGTSSVTTPFKFTTLGALNDSSTSANTADDGKAGDEIKIYVQINKAGDSTAASNKFYVTDASGKNAIETDAAKLQALGQNKGYTYDERTKYPNTWIITDDGADPYIIAGDMTVKKVEEITVAGQSQKGEITRSTATLTVAPLSKWSAVTEVNKALAAAKALNQADFALDSSKVKDGAIVGRPDITSVAKAFETINNDVAKIETAITSTTVANTKVNRAAVLSILRDIATVYEYLKPNAVDNSALAALIKECTAIKEDDYTYDSYGKLQDAIADANKANTTPYLQSVIDKAYADLKAAKDALVKEGEVDKTALTAAIASAKALKEEDYTKESWAANKDAIDAAVTAAQAVVDNATATQAQVNAALNSLTAAVGKLEKVGGEEEPPAEGPKAPANGTGWTLYNDEWYFFKNGTMVKNYWVGQADGASQWSTNWYYVGSNGKMATGMQYLDDLHGGYGWYFLQPTNTKGEIGKMLTGYQWVGGQYGECYFSKKSGESGKCTWSELLGNWNGTTWVK